MANMINFRRQFETTTLDIEGQQSKIWSVAFDPLGKYLLVGTDSSILVLNSESAKLIRAINDHEGRVYSVAYAPDGMSFVSGGSDKNVMLWKRNCDGILRYSHSYPIQYVEYNPISFDILSTTSNDLCIWSVKHNKRIHKGNIPSKCLSMNWSPNGKVYALTLQNNSVPIYAQSGKQMHAINHKNDSNNHHNIICCKWYDNETLMICSWNKLLSFYSVHFTDEHSKRIKVNNIQNTKLEFYPNSICLIKDSCIIISGLDSNLYLYTAQGTFVEKYEDMKTSEERDWILSICNHEQNKNIFYGTNNGRLICNKMIFKTVHSLFRSRYAYRCDNLCDLYIENIATNQKCLLSTNGYIRMIAIYKHRLALLFNDKILIYSSNEYDSNDLNYKLIHKIDLVNKLKNINCNLLIITNNNLVICSENQLELLDFEGKLMNNWKFNSGIRYIKNISGAPNKEGILIGLSNGEIYTVFINKKYPILHYKHNGTVRCVDINAFKTKLSIVDNNKKIIIYDLNEKKILFQDTNANSVAFNDEFSDMFAYTSNNGMATIRTFNGNFQFTAQTDGFIVRFNAETVYTLFASNNIMASFKIPQSEPLQKYIQSQSFDNAYKIACLGVTKYEWKNLGLKAIECMRFDIAKKAFTHLSSNKEIIKYVDFVNFIEMKYHNSKNNKNGQNLSSVLSADILAYEGQFDKAAKIYCTHKKYERAIEMYLDLRDWDNAKRINTLCASSSHQCTYSMNDLLLKQAKWLQSKGNKIMSAEMFWAANQYKTGFDILFETKQYDIIKPKILSLLRQQMNNTDHRELNEFYEYIANKFKKLNDISFVKEIYISTKNYAKLIEIYIEREEWDEAFIIINEHKEMKKDILLPYAKWLAVNDRFDEASKAFREAGYPKYAIKILNNLTTNCLIQNKYSDTAYYYWLLAIEHLKFGHIPKFKEYKQKSELYYAYNIVNEYLQSPFTSHTSDTLFHSARFALTLYNGNTTADTAQQISKVALLYILAKQCMVLGAFKLGRTIISKLITLRIPSEWREKIELDSLLIRTKPFTDPQHLSSYICARCSTTNYYSDCNTQHCIHCKHQFMRCMISFQTLPLVEFKIIDSLSHDEAIELINREPPRKNSKKMFKINESEMDDDNNGEQKTEEEANVLTFDDNNEQYLSNSEEDNDDDNDVFYQQLMDFDTADVNGGIEFDEHKMNDKACIVLDGIALERINPCEIFVIDYRKYCKDIIPKYYRCIVPEESYDIIICPNCQFLFIGEEYEVALINNGHLCAFCRFKFS